MKKVTAYRLSDGSLEISKDVAIRMDTTLAVGKVIESFIEEHFLDEDSGIFTGLDAGNIIGVLTKNHEDLVNRILKATAAVKESYDEEA